MQTLVSGGHDVVDVWGHHGNHVHFILLTISWSQLNPEYISVEPKLFSSYLPNVLPQVVACLYACRFYASYLQYSAPEETNICFFPDDWGGSGCSNGSRQIASGNTQSPGSPDSKYTSQLLSVFEECALLTICVITLLNGWMSWCYKSLQRSSLSGLGLWIVNGHHQEKGFRGWKTFCVLNIFHASAVSIVEVFNWLTVAKPPNVTPVFVSGCSRTSKQRLTGCGEQMLIQRLFCQKYYCDK